MAKIIKRALLQELQEHLKQPEISLLVGSRQVGKTTLMMFLKADLEKAGEKTLFLNLDFEPDRQFFETQSALLNKIHLELGKEGGFVFIDEIQRKENAGLFLKGIYDLGLPYKFIASGSGSVELKEKVHESLAGRKRLFELSPVSFSEFVNFKTGYKYEDRLADFFKVEADKTKDFLNDYASFGGYPKAVLAEDFTEKQKILAEIYQSYLEKDIAYLLHVRKTEAFSHLLRVLAGQAGQLTNFSELSATLGMALQTIHDYVWYLEKTYVINRVTPYFRNIRKEITRSPVFYFSDLGLKNYLLGNLGNIGSGAPGGFLFQNLAFLLLQERCRLAGAKINFWRTKDRAEVDFVIDFGNELIPVEVKYKVLPGVRVSKSLRSFIEKYQPARAFVLNLNFEHSQPLGRTMVRFTPFWQVISPDLWK